MKDTKTIKITNALNLHKTKSYRWIVFSCLAVSYFFVFFHRLSLGPIEDELTSCFGLSATSFASLGSMYFYAYLIMQIPTGILADTLGPRIVITVGSLITAIGTLIFSISPTIAVVFIGRFLIGLGVSVIYVCMIKVITQWFKESELGTMVGLTGFIGNMGGIAAQTPLALLVAAFSWRYTFAALALISVMLAILDFTLVRNTPQEAGLVPINEVATREETRQVQKKVSVREGLWGVLGNHRTWLIFIVLTGYSGGYLAFSGTWGISFIRNVYRLDNIHASAYIIFLVLGVSLGYLVIGFISDRLRSRKIPLIVLGMAVNILWFLLLYYDGGQMPMHTLGIVMLLIGICTICYSLAFSLGTEVNSLQYAGMAVSVVNLGAYIGGAIVPVIVGYMIDKYQGILTGIYLYRKGFMVCLVLNAVAFIASLFIKETHCRNIWDAE